MSQTKEQRIYKHYKALKKKVDYDRQNLSVVWTWLSEHWKMSIKELKVIVEREKLENAKGHGKGSR